MEKTIVYKRDGKFGKPEFFIALENFRILESKETPKAYACGSWYNNNCYVDGWIAKSLCKKIEGKICCPTWVTDKWTDLTNRIIKDYYHEEFEVREFPTEDSEKKEPEKIYGCGFKMQMIDEI